MSTVTVVSLSNDWEVQVRPVPPTATFKWEKANLNLPPKPGRPMATYTSELDGHIETVPALPDSKEWKEWELKMLTWREECDVLREDALYDESDYSIDYAIVAFRKKEEGPWLIEPPAEWKVPEAMSRHGADDFDCRRLAFIQLELLEFQPDYEKLHAVMFPVGEQSTAPVIKEEIRAALERFPSGDGGAARSLGASAGFSSRGHKDVNVRTGDASGGQKASIARRVVFLFKGK